MRKRVFKEETCNNNAAGALEEGTRKPAAKMDQKLNREQESQGKRKQEQQNAGRPAAKREEMSCKERKGSARQEAA